MLVCVLYRQGRTLLVACAGSKDVLGAVLRYRSRYVSVCNEKIVFKRNGVLNVNYRYVNKREASLK